MAFVMANAVVFADEVARLKFPAGQETFEISPVSAGTQTLTAPFSPAEVQWVHAGVTQRVAGGQLTLVFNVPAGETVVASKPQMLADGTLFVFSTVPAPAGAAAPSPAIAPTPAPQPSVAPAIASPPPPVVIRAPASAGAVAATPPPSPPPASAPSSVAPTAPTASTVPSALESEIEKFLPGALKFDPLPAADFAIPEAPGAAVLDQTTQVLKPGSPRETMTSLLSHFDGNGALNSGFSIGLTPYTMLRKEPVTLLEYKHPDNRWVRFMSRLQVSLAAKTGPAIVGGTTPALFGVGVSGVVFDNADPRMDDGLFQALSRLFPTAPNVSDEVRNAFARGEDIQVPPPSQQQLGAYDQITAAARNAKWNAAAMSFGYAVRLRSASGQVEDAKEDGGGAWLNYSMPGFGSLARTSQFLFTASYRYHDAFVRNGITGVEDTFNFAAQLRFGSRDFHGFAQAVQHWRRPKNQPRFSETTVEIGLEKKVMDNLWLNLGWSNDESLGGDSLLKTGLRYGFGQAAGLNSSP